MVMKKHCLNSTVYQVSTILAAPLFLLYSTAWPCPKTVACFESAARKPEVLKPTLEVWEPLPPHPTDDLNNIHSLSSSKNCNCTGAITLELQNYHSVSAHETLTHTFRFEWHHGYLSELRPGLRSSIPAVSITDTGKLTHLLNFQGERAIVDNVTAQILSFMHQDFDFECFLLSEEGSS